MKSGSFSEIYRDLLSQVKAGIKQHNNRTGTELRVIPGAYSFSLDLTDGKLPVPGNRKYFPHVAAAENAWQLMGTQDPHFIMRYAPKLWSQFLDEDGNVTAAYGYRWREHFGRDQLTQAIAGLGHGDGDRQLFVSAWDPATDGLRGPGQPLNVPCPVGFHVYRIDETVHMSVFIRSSDVFVGLPYDVMCYSLLLDCMSASIECTPGTIHFTLSHAHLYKPHWEAAWACLEAPSMGRANKGVLAGASHHWPVNVEPNLPAWSLSQIMSKPSCYVAQMKRLARRVNRNEWNYKPEVVA